MLQTVCFGFRFLKLDHRVLGLMKLSSLQTLKFYRCQLFDGQSAYHFGFLLYNMAVKRPDVICRLGRPSRVPQHVFLNSEPDL